MVEIVSDAKITYLYEDKADGFLQHSRTQGFFLSGSGVIDLEDNN